MPKNDWAWATPSIRNCLEPTMAKGPQKNVRIQVQQYLKEFRYGTAKKMAAHIGCSKSNVNRIIRELREPDRLLALVAWERGVNGGDMCPVYELRHFKGQPDQPRPRAYTGVEKTYHYRAKQRAKQKSKILNPRTENFPTDPSACPAPVA